MPAMFPGMNPYLEHPDLWPEIHPRFVAALADHLQKKVSDRYSVLIRKRVYRVSGENSIVVGQPAQAPTSETNSPSSQQPIPIYIAVPQTIHEDYIEIVDTHLGTTVTIVETLTPQKKRPGRGRENYEQRCESIFGGDTHFVEIDLLRGWEPISAYATGNIDYRVLVSRSDQRPKAAIYAWQVNSPIPLLKLPIGRPQDGDDAQPCCTVNLKEALNDACTGANYDFLINYAREPIPPLQPTASQWLARLLEKAGLRRSSQNESQCNQEVLKRNTVQICRHSRLSC
ncbi:MAG: DUF4058 family protein [Symploca sp. SIO2G7]|nr:DUF4058 family protein [Symploca sp. SIO2G7]